MVSSWPCFESGMRVRLGDLVALGVAPAQGPRDCIVIMFSLIWTDIGELFYS